MRRLELGSGAVAMRYEPRRSPAGFGRSLTERVVVSVRARNSGPSARSNPFEFVALVTRRHNRQYVVNTTLENAFGREGADQGAVGGLSRDAEPAVTPSG